MQLWTFWSQLAHIRVFYTLLLMLVLFISGRNQHINEFWNWGCLRALANSSPVYGSIWFSTWPCVKKLKIWAPWSGLTHAWKLIGRSTTIVSVHSVCHYFCWFSICGHGKNSSNDYFIQVTEIEWVCSDYYLRICLYSAHLLITCVQLLTNCSFLCAWRTSLV